MMQPCAARRPTPQRAHPSCAEPPLAAAAMHGDCYACACGHLLGPGAHACDRCSGCGRSEHLATPYLWEGETHPAATMHATMHASVDRPRMLGSVHNKHWRVRSEPAACGMHAAVGKGGVAAVRSVKPRAHSVRRRAAAGATLQCRTAAKRGQRCESRNCAG